MENKTIHQFNKGDKIQGYFLIKDVSCKITNGSNNKFLDINLVDKTGEINAKLWNCNEDQENMFNDNMLVKIRGNILEWKGKLQLKIELIRPITDEDDINIEDYVPTAPENPRIMYDLILKYVDRIKNNDIRNIVVAILDEIGPSIMYYPAAKSNHHAIRSGLLYHMSTMLKAGDRLSEVYDFIDKDLLFAGIILHDIAKIDEMDSSELGIVSEYTVEGQLLGHIVMGVRKVEIAAQKVKADKEISMLLQHMILTHHYEPEYGSPKKPMIPEAELLHYLDIMDARMYDMKKALKDVETGSFSDRIWSLDNLSVYKSKIDNIK
ncbi:3'-5' exoribonuclease YhaM [Clostridium tepidiprofundi DSM 19306]|uniref:3'-5' exoribonuclease YhaM n=1 Tax=Clostridium tepidiprofundi DSM 19306 TaxID=1121338 RepID=A0A151B4X4_9CLOT|nr:HD domain-containing protein [Clostridium tepidiprofundi]KYH34850.1 3'-5' exoribonuclease YhaM [Clostridium tepidiprofundi DSM 19306]